MAEHNLAIANERQPPIFLLTFRFLCITALIVVLAMCNVAIIVKMSEGRKGGKGCLITAKCYYGTHKPPRPLSLPPSLPGSLSWFPSLVPFPASMHSVEGGEKEERNGKQTIFFFKRGRREEKLLALSYREGFSHQPDCLSSSTTDSPWNPMSWNRHWNPSEPDGDSGLLEFSRQARCHRDDNEGLFFLFRVQLSHKAATQPSHFSCFK